MTDGRNNQGQIGIFRVSWESLGFTGVKLAFEGFRVQGLWFKH